MEETQAQLQQLSAFECDPLYYVLISTICHKGPNKSRSHLVLNTSVGTATLTHTVMPPECLHLVNPEGKIMHHYNSCFHSHLPTMSQYKC